jgi:large subunit ribosomal protein L15
MNLSNIQPAKGSTKKRKRVGRGEGSGHGGTSTRGHKGAKSRSGYSSKIGFEGGQMPLQRRVPKFGFTSPNRVEYKGVNLDTLQALVEKLGKNTIVIQDIIDNGLAGKHDLIKILGRGELNVKVEVSAHKVSKSALAAIESAGGSVQTIDRLAK